MPQPLRILDVGTGTGCLLLTLLCELPNATGVGTDISEAALEVARENAQRLGVGDRAAVAGRAMRSKASTALSISWSAIRPTSAPATSPTSSPRSAASIRVWRSMAATTVYAFFAALLAKSCSGRAERLDRARGRLRSGRRSCRPARRGHPGAGVLQHPSSAGMSTGMRRCVAARTRKLSICRESPWILSPSAIG